MRHHGQTDFLRHLECDIERHGSGTSRSASADPDLDSHNEIRVVARDLYRVGWREQTNILALADHYPVRERKNAAEGNVQVGEDAHLAALDHMFAEAGKVARSRAAGVDSGGHARAAAEIFGIDPE